MDRFDTLSQAAICAASRSSRWTFAYANDEHYDRERLFSDAHMHDEENPAGEDSYYVVSLRGAIGYAEDGETIDWLFQSPYDEVLPDAYSAPSRANFCPKCGTAVVPGAAYCGACGATL